MDREPPGIRQCSNNTPPSILSVLKIHSNNQNSHQYHDMNLWLHPPRLRKLQVSDVALGEGSEAQPLSCRLITNKCMLMRLPGSHRQLYRRQLSLLATSGTSPWLHRGYRHQQLSLKCPSNLRLTHRLPSLKLRYQLPAGHL